MNTRSKERNEAEALLTLNTANKRDVFCEAFLSLGQGAEERLKKTHMAFTEDECRDKYFDEQSSVYDEIDLLEEEFQAWLDSMFVQIGSFYVHEADVGGLDDIAHDMTWNWMTRHKRSGDAVNALTIFISKHSMKKVLDKTMWSKPIRVSRKI